MKPQKRTLKPSVIFFALAIIAALNSRAQVYDVAADFSTSRNPNGPWSYGSSASLGSSFSPYVSHDRMWELDLWRDQFDPNVTHNGTPFPIDTGFGIWPADQVCFHPGPSGEFSVVRWTASHSGTVAITSAFTGFDYVGPTTTDVHLLVNGVSVFDGIVEGFGSSLSFNTNLNVVAGDIVDCAVGFGRNGNYFNDTTGLSLTITAIDGEDPLEFLVPCAGPREGGKWKNHGEYQSALVHAARKLAKDGILTNEEMKRRIVEGARSDCGKRTANRD